MLSEESKLTYFRKKRSISLDGRLLTFDRPMVMGILNLTSDSFYDGGRYTTLSEAVDRVKEMVKQGADLIDIGAASSRPGADRIPPGIETERLIPVVREVRKLFPDLIISIDTFWSEVALAVNDQCGPCMINDISAGLFDDAMIKTAARLKVPYVAMHTRGTPDIMQHQPVYRNVTKEVILELSERVYRLQEAGVADIIVDPGFGFGKTLEHNYELFNHLDAFRFFELPVLVGISRKSMLYRLLNTVPDQVQNATTVLNTLALKAGADILRVHDVREAVEAVTIYQQLKAFAQ